MTLTKKLFAFSFVILSFLSLYFLVNTSLFEINSYLLSNSITIDVLLTIPLVYFLFIRKTDIPKLSIFPVIIVGALIASFIIPREHQTVLGFVKTWILPVLEIGILSFVIYKVVTTIKYYKQNKNKKSDFYTVLKITCSEQFPKFIASALAMEISVVYYGLINWKKKQLKSNEFTYHKKSGSISLYGAFILILAAESIGVHYLLRQSENQIGLWIITILSLYTAIQILGFAKSILKRPISIEKSTVRFRYGIMKELEVSINDILSIELTSREIPKKPEIKHLSLLGTLESHNVILHFKSEQKLFGLYGITKYVKSLAFPIDKSEEFKVLLKEVKAKLNAE